MSCECGGSFQRRNYVYVETVAGETLTCQTGYVHVCVKCGKRGMSEDGRTYDETKALALRLSLGTAQPADFKTARRLLGMRQVDLAQRLQIAPESISRIENGTRDINPLFGIALAWLLRDKLAGTDKHPCQITDGGRQNGEKDLKDADDAA